MMDALTPERIAHATTQGASVSLQDIITPSGQKTGQSRRRLVSPLELLWTRGSLDGRQWSACASWAALYAKLASTMGSTTSGYTPRMDGSPSGLRKIEYRCHVAAMVAKAKSGVPPRLWPVLDWIGEGFEAGLSTDDLALKYYPRDSKAVRVAKTVALIGLAADLLADHFEGR